MESSARRRDIIKNITIIFLIIMLVLTFFSSTILNRSLPEVAAQYAYSGQITTSVRANGVTQANENYQVIIEEGRVIQSVNVRRGDAVAVDDVLFILEDSESTEMQEALAALEKAELDYDKWLLQTKSAIEDQTREIKYAEEDLAKIQGKGVSYDVDTSDAAEAVSELKTLLSKLESELDTLKSTQKSDQREIRDANELVSDAEEAVKEAQAKLNALKLVVDEKQTAAANAERSAEAAELALEAAEADHEKKAEILKELQENDIGSSESIRQQLLSAERDIEDKTIALNREQAEYDELVKVLEEAKKASEELKRTLNRAETDYYNAQGNESIIADNIAYFQGVIARLSGQESLTDEEQKELQTARGELAYNQSMLSNIADNVSRAQQKLSEAQTKYNENQTLIQQTEDTMFTKRQTLEDMTRTLNRTKQDYEALKLKAGGYDTESAAQYQMDLKAAQEEEKAASKILSNAQKLLESAQKKFTEAEADYNGAVSEYEAAERTLESAQSSLKTAQKGLNDTKEDADYNISELLTEAEYEKQIAETETKLADAEAYLDKLEEQSKWASDGYGSPEERTEAITQKQRSISEMKTELQRTKETNALDEVTYTDSIALAEKEVERLSKTVGASVITAKVSGTINNIAVQAGQKVDAQTVLAEIEQQDKGYSVELTLTTEQAKRIAVGQAATILYYWGATPEAVVESIKPSQSDPQNSRIVTLLLTGDITAGQSFTFSLGERSANYDSVVPNSAIREDSNGKFVLVVEAKSTPIGNRYTAVRRDVEVIAEDDTNSAVSGLSGGEFVITTSTTPISAGQQVRLSDN